MTKPVTDEMKSAFVIAAWNGMIDELNATLAEHPDAVHWKDRFGATALRNAVAHGTHKMDVAKLMVARGADINAADNDGRTPLMYAAQSNAREYVDWLMGLGADALLDDKKWKRASDLAAEKGYDDIAGLLKSYEDRQEAAKLAESRVADIDTLHTGTQRPITVNRPLAFRLKA